MLQQFINYCETHLDFNIQAPAGYNSAPLCALDSVFSIGVRYSSVVKVVNRFLKLCGNLPIDTDINTSEVLKIIGETPGEILADQNHLDNHQKTDTKAAALLKADAFLRFLRVMRKYNIETCQDIADNVDNEDFKNCIKAIRGQTSGLTLEYLFILARIDTYVKVDRHIKHFVTQASGNEHLSKAEITALIRQTAEVMAKSTHPGMTARWLDHIIWRYDSRPQL